MTHGRSVQRSELSCITMRNRTLDFSSSDHLSGRKVPSVSKSSVEVSVQWSIPLY